MKIDSKSIQSGQIVSLICTVTKLLEHFPSDWVLRRSKSQMNHHGVCILSLGGVNDTSKHHFRVGQS